MGLALPCRRRPTLRAGSDRFCSRSLFGTPRCSDGSRPRRIEPTTTDRADHDGSSRPRLLEPATILGAGHDPWSRPRRMELRAAPNSMPDSIGLGRLQPAWPTPTGMADSNLRGRLQWPTQLCVADSTLRGRLQWPTPTCAADSNLRGRLQPAWPTPTSAAGSIRPGPEGQDPTTGPWVIRWTVGVASSPERTPVSARWSSCIANRCPYRSFAASARTMRYGSSATS